MRFGIGAGRWRKIENNNMTMKKLLLELWYLVRYTRSYAQEGEDAIIEDLWESRYGRRPGFFVEVGGYHPVRFSNTLRLYRRGWRGIVVEPTPARWWLWALMRPRDLLVKLAVGASRQVRTFYCFDEGALNKFAMEVEEYGNRQFIANLIPVQQDTLACILENSEAGQRGIDLLSIDIEGMEMDALRGNDWARYRPKMIIVEDRGFEIARPDASETYRYLTGLGYRAVAKTRRNVIYELFTNQQVHNA